MIKFIRVVLVMLIFAFATAGVDRWLGISTSHGHYGWWGGVLHGVVQVMCGVILWSEMFHRGEPGAEGGIPTPPEAGSG